MELALVISGRGLDRRPTLRAERRLGPGDEPHAAGREPVSRPRDHVPAVVDDESRKARSVVADVHSEVVLRDPAQPPLHAAGVLVVGLARVGVRPAEQVDDPEQIAVTLERARLAGQAHVGLTRAYSPR